MEPAQHDPHAEAELQRFREQWRAEVAQHRRPKAASGEEPRSQEKKNQPQAGPSVPTTGRSLARTKAIQDLYDEVEPRAYHDLPDKEELKKLGIDGQNHDRNPYKEPSTALEHYERAVEKETQGNLGDSLSHYRRAFKLDDGVHEAYKKKHFPPSSFVKPKLTNPNPSNAAVTVPGTAHHSLHGSAFSSTLKQLLEEFSTSQIEAVPPPTDASPQPRSYLAELPEEILIQVLAGLAVTDLPSFVRLALVCKRLAYLVLTEESLWKPICMGHEYGFAAMHYNYVTDVKGRPLEPAEHILDPSTFTSTSASGAATPDPIAEPDSDSSSVTATSAPPLTQPSLTTHLLTTTYASSYRHMFRLRPRLRFNGCYISTVNYTRAGATSTNTLTWGAPVHVVTYFRYLRFFRDGTCISLLTTAEPADVVHVLGKEALPALTEREGTGRWRERDRDREHTALLAGSGMPSHVMKDALRGRWRLTGPLHRPAPTEPISEAEAEEDEGELIIETLGVVPKYTYKLVLSLAHAGKGARNNKLAWKWFGSYNTLTDDWGEFGLRNDRAFYWSRVRSYGDGV